MRSKVLINNIVQWVSMLNARALPPDVEIVVEGFKDVRSLKGVGIKGRFTLAYILLRDIKEEGCKRVKDRTFIILTDFDKEGIILYKRLKRILTELGGKLDDFPRKQYISMDFPPLIEEFESFTRRRVEDWDYLKIE